MLRYFPALLSTATTCAAGACERRMSEAPVPSSAAATSAIVATLKRCSQAFILGSGTGIPPQRTAVFICRMGMMIEKATNPIAPPIATIMIGSSNDVSDPMRTSTWDS